METYNKVGWVVAILVFVCGIGWALSGNNFIYREVEITPAIDATYELIPLTPAQIFGEQIFAVAGSAIVALILGGLTRGVIKTP